MENQKAPDVRLSFRQASVQYGVGAALVCVGNMIAGGLASYGWAGPLQGVASAAASVRVSGCVLLVGWIVILLVKPARKARNVAIMLGAIFVVTAVFSYVQAMEPSAARVFESELGFEPDADFSELRSFMSQSRIRVPTIGLQFRVNEKSLARLVRELRLDAGHVQVDAAWSIREKASRSNPVPDWFANDKNEVRMKRWERTDDNGDLEIALDQDQMVVYVVRQAR